MQFLPPLLERVSTTTFKIKEGVFIYKSSVVVDEGWKAYFTDVEPPIKNKKMIKRL